MVNFEQAILYGSAFGFSLLTFETFLKPNEWLSTKHQAKGQLLLLLASGLTVFVFHELTFLWYLGSIGVIFVSTLVWTAFKPDPPSPVSKDIDDELHRLRQNREKTED